MKPHAVLIQLMLAGLSLPGIAPLGWQSSHAQEPMFRLTLGDKRLPGTLDTLAFSPDGKTLAVGGWKNGVNLWDLTATRQKPILTLIQGNLGTVDRIVYSSDGKTIAVGTSEFLQEPLVVELWDVTTGKKRTALSGYRLWAFSPDGKTLALSSDKESVVLWEVSTGKEIVTLKGHAREVWTVAFSPDGKTLASGSADETVVLWDLVSGKEKHVLQEHTGLITDLAFSPDGKILASSSFDQTIKLWKVAAGKELATFEIGGEKTGALVAFSPDGKTLVSAAGYPSEIKLLDVPSGKTIARLPRRLRGVKAVAFSPDGKVLAAAGDSVVKLWDMSEVDKPERNAGK